MPRPWSIDEALRPDGKPLRLLRIGHREIDLADIVAVTETRIVERDVRGLALIGAMFAVSGIVFLIGVTGLGWRTRFLIGAAFLGALAAASFGEALQLGPVRYRRLVITTRRGAELTFASADDREVDALAAALGLGRSDERGTMVAAGAVAIG